MSRSVNDIKKDILSADTALGIELGSTRIKAVLIDSLHEPIAAGSHEWENRLENGIWTYDIRDVWAGLQDAYRKMAEDVKVRYDMELENIGAIGFSAMMHGYMAFDEHDRLLVPFRTWRNTTTGPASERLLKEFHYNIPMRWSIAHLYQAILNQEDHVKNIAYLTTLAGYVHWMLTGEKVLGVGDASGMFPIDGETKDYDKRMLEKFDRLTADQRYAWKLGDILPKVLLAGENAGYLTEAGAKLLDVTGRLRAGIPVCPAEGDAGTGMVATNSVKQRTGNVSAGTSVFLMVVLEKELSKVYPELDMVTTPDGSLVAMVHCNTCTSDLNAWVNLFGEFASAVGVRIDQSDLFELLYKKALEGDRDCGGLLSCCYCSGEPITGFDEGRPLFVRTQDSRFTLANVMRTHLYSSLASLKIGMDILFEQEKVELDELMGHGGFFKTEKVGQSLMAAAANVKVTCMKTAGEGGAWGMALLASYMKHKEEREALDEFLEEKVFRSQSRITMEPDPEDVKGFGAFMERYIKLLAVEKAAVEAL